jgi:hypothetical protein
MSRLAAHLAGHHQVVLMTWEAPEIAPFYPIPSAVTVVRADLFGGTVSGGW